MLLIIISIIMLILSIILIKVATENWFDGLLILGILIAFISGGTLIGCITALAIKPLIKNDFIARYETIKEMPTYNNDIRDATYTQSLIEINEEIKKCNIYINNKFIGIFEIKEICETEPLKKGE